jgi:hypothetical protein
VAQHRPGAEELIQAQGPIKDVAAYEPVSVDVKTSPTERDQHLQSITEHGRVG